VSTDESGRKAVTPLVALLGGLLAVSVVAVAVLAVLAAKWHGDVSKWHDAQAEDAAGRAALAAARADLTDITTYDYKTIGKDFAWLDDFSDPKTSAPFAKNQKVLAKVVQQSRTVAKGDVTDAMSRVVSPSQVEVLAFVDQVLRSDAGKGYKLEQQRVSMTMKLVAGDWKISRLDLLGGNNDS
jgi:hypothetical protein